MDFKRAKKELRDHYERNGNPQKEITNESLWHWMLLTNDGAEPIPEHDPDLGLSIFLANPWESPWGKDIAPGKATSSGRILICSTNVGFGEMGIGDKESGLSPKFRAICQQHGVDPTGPIELSRDIAQFWDRFYGCCKLFSDEPMSIPAIIITNGEMRHYAPGGEGMCWEASDRLRAAAKAYNVPIVFV
jgi:hypothetical protein